MGLTKTSMGKGAMDCFLQGNAKETGIRIALCGNPNVGKSTIFNRLTGLHQHTGNWPGKTVAGATGTYIYNGETYTLVDLPGCYSLLANSAEEEVARDFLCFKNADAVVIVCDATCLERNLNLVLQILEITSKAVVCVNLLDEAKRKGIEIDTEKLEQMLGVSVVCTAVKLKHKSNYGYHTLLYSVDQTAQKTKKSLVPVYYGETIEEAICTISEEIEADCKNRISARWLSLKFLTGEESAVCSAEKFLGEEFRKHAQSIAEKAQKTLNRHGIEKESIKDMIKTAMIGRAEEIAKACVKTKKTTCHARDRKIDRILTGKTGFLVMALLFFFVFWLTIVGSNYPSEVLSSFFFETEKWINHAMVQLGIPDVFCKIFVFGVYRMVTRVVAVMLPPMAIFFPLFTILEDLGYLPRVAFNLDKCFQKCSACGKQALTMCMGFGCNAVGVVGARIIDSPRERLIAMITNNFVPCNGRFPTLVALISMFFVTGVGVWQSVYSAAILFLVISLGIGMTFLASKILSVTMLSGVPSSFVLELPPYRKPQIGKILVRSIFDRTLFVLGRAVSVAAPAGLVIWFLANTAFGDGTLLSLFCGALDPIGKVLGMDGVILMAFVLGFPANETVIPIMLMAYLSGGTLVEITDISTVKQIFSENGWTMLTAINVMLFSLMHWPCSTTLLSIKKESGSIKWTLVSAAFPTMMGILACLLTATVAKLIA